MKAECSKRDKIETELMVSWTTWGAMNKVKADLDVWLSYHPSLSPRVRGYYRSILRGSVTPRWINWTMKTSLYRNEFARIDRHTIWILRGTRGDWLSMISSILLVLISLYSFPFTSPRRARVQGFLSSGSPQQAMHDTSIIHCIPIYTYMYFLAQIELI